MSPLCGVALTPDCGIVNLFATFRVVISDTRSVHSIFTPVLHVHIFSAHVHRRFSLNSWQTYHHKNVSEYDYLLLYYTRVHNVCEYIQSTHWLVPGYCLGQIFLHEEERRDASPGT